MIRTTTRSLPFTTLVLAFAAGACEGDQGPPGPPGGFDPDAPALDKAFAATGGKANLLALSSYTLATSGERLMTGEGFTPDDGAHPVGTFTAQISTDVTADKLRIDYARQNSIFGAMPSYKVILDGDVGVVHGTESVFGFPGGDLPSERWAAERRQQYLTNPQLLLREVAAGDRTATEAGIAIRDGELRQRIELSDPTAPIELYIEPYSGEITELTTLENDHPTGDVEVAAHYLGWRTWDAAATAVAFPSDIAITVNDQPFHVERREAVATNVALDPSTFAFPAGAMPAHDDAGAARGARNSQFLEMFAALGVPLDALQTTIDAQQLAPGVFHLRGGTHHSLVIEQQAGVVVVEAPLYEARALAVLDWIATNIPGKPVTHVIATHHHRDHTGALRTFVARGAKIVVGDASKAFFSRAFRASRTIEPDELSAHPAPATILGVPAGGTLTLPDAAHPVQVVAVETTHAADMVIAYVPSAKTVFVSDIYSPGFPPNPFGAREVLGAIQSRGLAVDTLAGGHGGVGPRSDLDAIAGM
ncbi:MAG TPA: MBL fold metallo-hydrolase [Kofleriaceae bacterium]|nr:MBL fold metallo-hydrolase [Kofleriaceae bacterium]